VTAEELAALPDWRASGRFDALDKLALEYAEAMTRTPAVIPDALFDALKSRLTPAQLVELTAVIAQENFRARFNHAFGLRPTSQVQRPTSVEASP
jgi:alkylhydroperoxidase family enzyme